MSPEIFDGDIGYGARTDIWSLAAVLFEFANNGCALFEDFRELMQWESEPDMDLITNSNIGNFSKTFLSFFRNMLSIERHRPHATTVLQKSRKYEYTGPYQVEGKTYFDPNRNSMHDWIIIN